MKPPHLNPVNDNGIEPTGVERCLQLLTMAAGHPELVVGFMMAVSMLTDIALQNDEDGFHIAADAAGDVLDDKPATQIQTIMDAAGYVAGFEGWPAHFDGLVAAIEQAMLETTFTDRLRSLRALMMCAADGPVGDWGWEIAWFLNNRRSGHLQASAADEYGMMDLENEMRWRSGKPLNIDGNVSDGP